MTQEEYRAVAQQIVNRGMLDDCDVSVPIYGNVQHSQGGAYVELTLWIPEYRENLLRG